MFPNSLGNSTFFPDFPNPQSICMEFTNLTACLAMSNEYFAILFYAKIVFICRLECLIICYEEYYKDHKILLLI